MASSIHVYASEDAARNAVSKLQEAGFRAQKAFVPSELSGQEEAAVKAGVDSGLIPAGNATGCIGALQAGRSFVAAAAPMGRGRFALDILENCADGDGSYALPYPIPGDAAPFSDTFGLPVLTKFVASTGLLKTSWYFSKGFGLPLLGGGAAILPFPTIMKQKHAGKPVPRHNPSPLSSMLFLPTLIRSKSDWETSFAYPLLARNPAPISSLLGIPVLID